MEEAGLKKGDPRLKAIAVTMGPGQEMSINVGLRKAKELGKELNIPVIPVNHLEGHVMVNLIPLTFTDSSLQLGESPTKSRGPPLKVPLCFHAHHRSTYRNSPQSWRGLAYHFGYDNRFSCRRVL